MANKKTHTFERRVSVPLSLWEGQEVRLCYIIWIASDFTVNNCRTTFCEIIALTPSDILSIFPHCLQAYTEASVQTFTASSSPSSNAMISLTLA